MISQMWAHKLNIMCQMNKSSHVRWLVKGESMINVFKVQFFILCSLVFFSNNAIAVNCDEASPNLLQDGDIYYDVVGMDPLTKKQSRRVDKFISRIKGRWKGEGEKSHCVESKKRTYNYTLEAEVDQNSDGKLVFEITSLDTQSKALRDETFRFLGAANQYHVTKLTEDSLGLYIKYRRPNAVRDTEVIVEDAEGNKILKRVKSDRRVSVFIEEIVEITGDKKVLNLNFTKYLNGYFAEEFHRKFHR